MNDLESYTAAEAARKLGVSVKTLYNLVSARKITAKRGRPLLIPRAAVQTYIRKRTDRALA